MALHQGSAKFYFSHSYLSLQAIDDRVEKSFTGFDKTKGEKISNTIRLMTKTQDKKEFYELLASVLNSLTDDEGNQFKRYFMRHVKQLKTWAPFER